MLCADITHTRGPLDGSLYAQVKKRRGPDSSNGGPTDSPDGPPAPYHAPAEPPEEIRRLPPPTRREREELDRLLGGMEGRRARGGVRETAILDEGEPAPSLGRSCSCRRGGESPTFLSNGYCPTNHPTPSSAPPTLLLDPFQHHHVAPPPSDVLWERQQQGPPSRLQRTCSEGPSRHLLSYPAQDLPMPPHIHTLPPPRLLYKGDYPPLHHHYPRPHRSQPSSPYREVMLLDAPPPPGCPCRDCSCRREESAAATAKALHALHLDQGEGSLWDREAELHWDREAGLRRSREMALQWERDREVEMHWEREREAEFWHRRPTATPYSPHSINPVHFAFDPLPLRSPCVPRPLPHSLVLPP